MVICDRCKSSVQVGKNIKFDLQEIGINIDKINRHSKKFLFSGDLCLICQTRIYDAIKEGFDPMVLPGTE